MNNYIFIFSCCLIISCNQTSSDSEIHEKEITSKTNITTDTSMVETITDTLLKLDKYVLLDVLDWKTEDFIIHKKDQSNESLKNLIEYEREDWKNAPNPIVAVYKGNDFGDYFHLNFEDENGNIYDFGYGENSFGDFELYNENDFEDNSKYVGKKFTIYWNWVISKFSCCDGEYELVEAYWPSITKLELIK